MQIPLLQPTAEPNPLLSSVLAQNKSFLSVEVTWHLTDHAVFTAAQVSLKLRLLNCSEWSYKATNTSQEYGIYRFEHLQPSSVYILNITLHNKHQQTENRAVVFWSAASNSSGMRCHFSIFLPRLLILVPRVTSFFSTRLNNEWLWENNMVMLVSYTYEKRHHPFLSTQIRSKISC